jgi:hypothetical protein
MEIKSRNTNHFCTPPPPHPFNYVFRRKMDSLLQYTQWYNMLHKNGSMHSTKNISAYNSQISMKKIF